MQQHGIYISPNNNTDCHYPDSIEIEGHWLSPLIEVLMRGSYEAATG